MDKKEKDKFLSLVVQMDRKKIVELRNNLTKTIEAQKCSMERLRNVLKFGRSANPSVTEQNLSEVKESYLMNKEKVKILNVQLGEISNKSQLEIPFYSKGISK